MPDSADKQDVKKRAVKIHRSQAGFSFVEILVLTGMLAIIAVVVASVSASLTKMQSRATLLTTISQMAKRMENAAREADAWRATVAEVGTNNQGLTGMNCLRQQNACGGPNTPRPFALFDANGDLIYNGIAATRGFTMAGLPCNAYSAVAPGNSACPLRWNLTWQFQCTPSCVNPQIRIDGILEYNGIPDAGPINPANYNFSVIRGVGSSFEQVIVTYRQGTNVGESDCVNTAAWNPRQLSSPPVSDQAGLATVAANRITLRAGSYECHISAPGYRIGANRVRMRNFDTGQIVGLGQSAYSHVLTGDQVYASAQARIDISTDARFVIEHRCTNQSGTSFGFGMPVPDEAGSYVNPLQPTVYTVVRCVKLG